MATEKYVSHINHHGQLLTLKDAEARQGTLYPVDIATLTPQSTFRRNAVLGINGVLYRATAATANLPCTLVTDGDAFVIDTVNGKRAFAVSDPTPNADWEVWTDAGLEYWLQLLDARKQDAISDLADIRSGAAAGATALQLSSPITYGGQPYTVEQLLQAVASLMTKTVVADG